MAYTIASWNIEKNGVSSTDIKQEKVSEFLVLCCKYGITVIFLCEVHSSRVDDYLAYCRGVYGGQYEIGSLPGGHSNAYILLYRKDVSIVVSQDKLKGLNRGAIILNLPNNVFLCLAHFKSGQTGLTKDQLQQASGFLEGACPGHWVITGDMNWAYGNATGLTLPPGSRPATCWTDQTQVKGGILDWCLVGAALKVETVDVANLFPPAMNDMSGPDHRPIIFSIDLVYQ